MAVAMLAAAYGLGGTSLTDVLLTVIAVLLPIIVFLSAAIATTAACPWRLSSETQMCIRDRQLLLYSRREDSISGCGGAYDLAVVKHIERIVDFTTNHAAIAKVAIAPVSYTHLRNV